ncbi:MAG TPA: TolC family protein [Gemmatimonadaceae bacterium]|jgi:outer membrane protein TolC|nr:TolC family protein [Gemmatimonadaceae bacterium]
MVRRAATLLAAMLGLAAPAAGAQRAAAEPLRLGELYARVEGANPRVATARALVSAAQARVPGARRPPDPQLQLGFMNYTLPGLAPMETLGMTQLQLMQMLPLGGKLGYAGRVAGARAAAQGERAREVVWELRSQTAMAFYDLYATDRRLDVERETLRLLRDIASTAQSMYRVGEGRQADVLRAEVGIARMAEDTLRMEAMRQTMIARLDALLDRDAPTEVGTPALPRFPDSLPARAWLDSVAVGGRPMIRAGLEDVRAADASASLARRELIPDLQIGVQYGQQGATMTDPAGMTQRRTERMGSLMLGASIPIFARDRQLQMRTEASAMRAMAEAEVAAMRAETRGKIGEAYALLTRARNLARLYRTTVLPQAEATVASALSAYRVGSVDFMTLLDDQMAVNRYREELATLDADEGKAWADLELLSGRELLDPFTAR